MGLASTQIPICFTLDLDLQPWVNLAISRMALFSKIQSQCNFLWILTENWVPNLSFKMPSFAGRALSVFPLLNAFQIQEMIHPLPKCPGMGHLLCSGDRPQALLSASELEAVDLRCPEAYRVTECGLLFPFTVYWVLGNYKCWFPIVSNTLFKTLLLVKCRNQLKL